MDSDKISLDEFELFRNDIRELSDQEKVFLFLNTSHLKKEIALQLAQDNPNLLRDYLGSPDSYQMQIFLEKILHSKSIELIKMAFEVPGIKQAVTLEAQRSPKNQEKWLNEVLQLIQTSENRAFAVDFIKLIFSYDFLEDYRIKNFSGHLTKRCKAKANIIETAQAEIKKQENTTLEAFKNNDEMIVERHETIEADPLLQETTTRLRGFQAYKNLQKNISSLSKRSQEPLEEEINAIKKLCINNANHNQ